MYGAATVVRAVMRGGISFLGLAEPPEMRGLQRAKFVFADHPLVPVHLVFDSIPRTIALSEEEANYFVAALGRMIDASLREKFHRLTDAVLVL